MECDYTSICGNRQYNEDRIIFNNNMAIVIDGDCSSCYNGNLVDILYDLFPTFIMDKLEHIDNSDEIIRTISNSCVELDRLIHKYYNPIGSASLSGIIRINGDIYVINVGNCRTVLFNGIIPVYVTEPHTMKNKEERKRIESSLFTYKGKAEGLYNITRCFGNYSNRKRYDNASYNGPYDALADVKHITSKFTHAFIHTTGLKAELNSLIFTALSAKDKISTTIINENKSESNISLIVLTFTSGSNQ